MRAASYIGGQWPGVEGGGFAGLRGGQLDPRGQLQPLNPLNPAAADVAPGVSGVEGAG